MVSSVAVLSDVHGVLPALTAVLAEPLVRDAEVVVLTGDLAAGPQPVETLDLLVSLGDRARWVRGNADRELTRPDASEPVSRWAASQLRPDQVSLLAGLPLSLTLEIDGLGPVLFCHATPRDDEEVVLVDSPMSRWADVLGDVPDEVRTVVCGHTHMPFARQVDRRLVLNPGSVGMPYGAPGPHWMVLGDGVQFRRTALDLNAAADQIVAESAYPERDAWADEYVRTNYSDAEALAAFTPRSRG
ncbi:metallophosphoesterase family protein [Kribbella deserti]|uniref:Metallophosphoesterase family protein n=1 Tax=Kribbella deserti TaxID=1926257 RepID=A0ABV6QVD3_9ACTN